MKNSLLIIPCCKFKKEGGNSKSLDYIDPLSRLIDGVLFKKIQETRTQLSHIIEEGDREHFLPAIERYVGYFYRATPNMAQVIREKTNWENQPKLLILSALYGPLHPESLINIYDLLLKKNASPWTAELPLFLENYVERNQIESIRVYCESDYAEVLELSIRPLLSKKKLSEAILYEARGEDVQAIYTNYGAQLIKDLEPENSRLGDFPELEITLL